jgi:hypothetical protein
MTLNALLAFMVISQIAVSAYLLYSFNTIERANRRRHETLTTHVDEALAAMESRLTGTPRPRSTRIAEPESTMEARPEILQPRQV